MVIGSTSARDTSAPAPASVAANSLWLLAAQIGSKLLGFALPVALARMLSVEAYGQFVLAFAFAALFTPLLDLGMDLPSTRATVRDPLRAPDVLGGALLAKMALAALALPIAVVATHWGSEAVGPQPKLVACAVGAGFVTVLGGSYLSVFRGWQRMDLEAVSSLVARGGTLVASLLVAALGAGLIALGLAQVIGGLLGLLFAAGLASRHGLRPSWRAGRARIGELVSSGVPFAVTALLVTIYFRIDAVILGWLQGDRSVALYHCGVQLMLSAMMPSQALATAAFPVMAGFRDWTHPEARRLLRRAIALSLATSLPIALGTAALGPWVLRILYGEPYVAAWRALALLMAALPVLFVTNLIGYCLGALGRQSLVLAVAALNATVNVTLNLVLIPRYDFEGAALATVLTELCGLASFLFLLRRELAAVLGPAPRLEHGPTVAP